MGDRLGIRDVVDILFTDLSQSKAEVSTCYVHFAQLSLHAHKVAKDLYAQKTKSKTCRDPGSNRGPLDLQSNALPSELSRLNERPE